MITVIRSGTVQPGKMAEAIAWSKKVLAIFKRVTGKKAVTSVAFGGALDALAWIVQYDSVAQFEELTDKLMADPEYMAAITVGDKPGTHPTPLFVAGSFHDQIWRQLS